VEQVANVGGTCAESGSILGDLIGVGGGKISRSGDGMKTTSSLLSISMTSGGGGR
jgi:hypothetical protein